MRVLFLQGIHKGWAPCARRPVARAVDVAPAWFPRLPVSFKCADRTASEFSFRVSSSMESMLVVMSALERTRFTDVAKVLIVQFRLVGHGLAAIVGSISPVIPSPRRVDAVVLFHSLHLLQADLLSPGDHAVHLGGVPVVQVGVPRVVGSWVDRVLPRQIGFPGNVEGGKRRSLTSSWPRLGCGPYALVWKRSSAPGCPSFAGFFVPFCLRARTRTACGEAWIAWWIDLVKGSGIDWFGVGARVLVPVDVYFLGDHVVHVFGVPPRSKRYS